MFTNEEKFGILILYIKKTKGGQDLMNNEYKSLQPDGEHRGTPTKAAVLGVTVLAAVSSVLSAFSIAFLLCSAALYGWLVSAAKRPVLTVFAPAAAAAVLWLVTKDISSFVNPVFIYLTGAVCGICIRKKLHLWRSAAYSGIVVGVMFIVSFLFLLLQTQREYVLNGELVQAVAAWWNELTASFTEYFSQLVEAAGAQLELELTPSMMKELMDQTAVLFPGILAALFSVVGAAVYLLSRASHKIFGTEELIFSVAEKRIHFGVSIHLAVFFLISAVMAAICSAFKNSHVPQFAFVNLCIGMFVPMLSNGIYMLIAKLRSPVLQVVSPDGEVMKTPPNTLILWIIIPITVINPLMGMLFVAFFGAVEEIKFFITAALIKRSRKKHGGEQE